MKDRENPRPPSCRLCLEDKALHDSHILPEFLFDGLYDEKHRAVSVHPAKGEQRFIQKGIRERLLCGDCETRFSRHETYAAGILRKLSMLPGDDIPGQLLEVHGVDYSNLKLFQMSLLWRMGVASDPLFAAVDLESHAEILRSLLVTDDPGAPLDYCCLMATIPRPHKLDQLIRPPRPIAIGEHTAIALLAGGIHWFFVVSAGAEQLPLGVDVLGPGGVLRVGVTAIDEQEILASVARDMAAAERHGSRRRE